VLASSATVSAAEHDPDGANNSDSETTTVTTPLVWMGTRAKTVLANAGRFVINEAVTYTITLTNAGDGAQADNPGHELTDTLPSALALVSADATSGAVAADVAGNTVTWDGSLPAGASVTLTIHATVRPTVGLGTTVSNQATVSYDPDADGTNEATTLTDDPDEPGTSDPTRFVVVSPPQGFFTLEPCRLLDTRLANGTYGGPALVADTDRVFPLFGRCGIPSTARAVSVNLTATQSTAQGNLRLYPAGTPLPLVSSVNYVVGLTRANNAVVPLNGLGEIAVRCIQASGTVHFVLDVNGYFE
jgi:fimbrial isopeptide formation D2 family protein